MRKDEIGTWLTLKEGAKQLNITEDEVQDLIDNNEVDGDDDEHGKVWALAADVVEMAAYFSPAIAADPNPTPPPKSNPRKPKIHNPKSKLTPPPSRLTPGDYTDCPKSPSGAPLLTIAQAAPLLNMTLGSLGNALRQGRIDGWKENGRWLVHYRSIERYSGKQQNWAAAGGPAKAYFQDRRRLKDLHAGLLDNLDQSNTQSQHSIGDSQPSTLNSQLSADPYWISTREAEAILQLSPSGFRRLANKENLTKRRQRIPRPDEDLSGHRAPLTRAFYILHEIVAVSDRRERSAKTITPAEWKRDLRHPVIRTTIEPPPGDRLISLKHAAEILGVTPGSVHQKVETGRLFGWQKAIGRRGSRIFVSERQVVRLAADPDYLKRQTARMRGKSVKDARENELWWVTENGLRDPDRKSTKPVSGRNHGEFFNTVQVARLLGISKNGVHALRRRGRLKGHRGSQANPRSRWAWWFYNKEEVWALMADTKYLAARDRAKATRERGPRPLTEDELYEFIKINAFGRPPRGQIMDTGWSWGDPRIHHISPFVVDPNDPPGGWWDRETWREMLK